MDDVTMPLFVDIDPSTGRSVATTHESMRTAFSEAYVVSDHVPEAIRAELAQAIDIFALAFGQANAQNGQLYNPLTDNAFLGAMRAFEMALRDLLPMKSKNTLNDRIEEGMRCGLLPNSEQHQMLYLMLRRTRNAITHHEGTSYIGGSFLGKAIGVLIWIINDLYDPTQTSPELPSSPA